MISERAGRGSVPRSKASVLDDACLLLAHNPDYVEYIRDPRVDLVLSGHTHGGQVVLPFYGAPITSSRFWSEVPRRLDPGAEGAGVRVARHRDDQPAGAVLLSARNRAADAPEAAFRHPNLRPNFPPARRRGADGPASKPAIAGDASRAAAAQKDSAVIPAMTRTR